MRPLRSLRQKKTAGIAGPRATLAQSSEELGLDLDDVVIVFACSDNFAPYMSVAMQSIIENSSEDRHYDFVVLTRDLSPTSMLTLSRQASQPNIGIGFLDVYAVLGDTVLPHHGHFRPETYFRLLAPTFLDNVDKAIYLDSDLVVLDDIAKLFDIDIANYMLGATRDADTIGQICGYDGTVEPYLYNSLHMTEPLSYFQAGVLLMNLKLFRETITPEEIIDIATSKTWRWLDQDILNMLVDDDYVEVPMRWNYLVDWQGLRRTHIVATAPQEIQDEYEEARRNIAIAHFAGPDNRPWHYPNCDFGGLFWLYAQDSPYYEALLKDLFDFQHNPKYWPKRAHSAFIFKGFMPFFDKNFKPGTDRRTAIIDLYSKFGDTNR